MFWAAAVLMPIFQMLAACTVAIIKRAAKRLFRFILKAAMIPSTMGTMQPTLAVVLGTKKASTKPTKIMPARILLVLAPTLDRTKRAMRLSSPVCIMAAARKRAAPTSTVPLALTPAKAIFRALEVPKSLAGSCGSGDSPRHKIINVAMMVALTG